MGNTIPNNFVPEFPILTTATLSYFSSYPSLINYAELAETKELTIRQINKCQNITKLQTDRYCDRSTLYYASRYCSLEIVETLLKKNPNIDINEQLSDSYLTPLNAAVNNKKWDIVRLLIQKGANPNLADIQKWNSLHYAGSVGAPNSIIQLLVDHGVDVTCKNVKGYTARDLALNYGNVETASFLENVISKPPTKSAKFMV
jgi:ankyrin repeat protein